jgi:hypothetical protein
MPTPDELRAAIAEGRDELRAAIRDAAKRWESPVAAADGEERWTARQAAEHAIGAEVYFATQVCVACGYPGLEPASASYGSAEEALQGLQEVAARSDGRLKYVTDKDLVMTHEQWGDVTNLLSYNAIHLREHAAQIRTATGSQA